jgi:hypothetical protein
MKTVISGVDSRVVVWVREFFFVILRVRVVGQSSEKVRVTSEVLRGRVLGQLLFLAYVNDIWRNLEATIELFTDNCIIYKKVTNDNDIDTLKIDLDRLGSGR